MHTTKTQPTADAHAASGHAPTDLHAATAAGTPGSAAEAAELIGAARERIDTLDGRIIELVRERMAVSAGIQQARVSTGGRRVHLSREMEILSRFRAELGRPGTTLAMTLLELCRGRA
ncbi:chorismate mutase [Streptomyces sp. 549]|uniref:chorismate mutase n=1 Tax=Streptomyces sp. 549 TaxID=3049076 RepID=UPI0024C3583C|nr:chorismate mutase [Streptomyces sp. 549]MDK1472811.1 chorismate mutase [Streptomyces sp. 549]